MLKIIVATLALTTAVVAGHAQKRPRARHQQPNAMAAVADRTIVTIYFRGLMVFHEERDGYEVGILMHEPHHKFHVLVNENEITQRIMDIGLRDWTFQIEPAPASQRVTTEPRGHNRTRPDSELGTSGFDWIIDLDGPNFHGSSSLTVNTVKLKPVFHLRNGRLYTENKSIDLVRCRGYGPNESQCTHYGFVPETIAFDIILPSGHNLILYGDSSNKIELLTAAPGRQTVEIYNVQPSPPEKSDFYLYYDLLEINVDPRDQFSFKRNDIDRVFPYNPGPRPRPTGPLRTKAMDERTKAMEKRTKAMDEKIFTCCQMDCTSIRLLRHSF